ncbi:alpha/beta fold hydrolase [Planctomicrobium sp. SH527]|uniref:alpha/beta fold hydrolase n=1 Tax=Planctomicrobium sp. SH527 TaxID=3448123 RepID=UPI003F5B117A
MKSHIQLPDISLYLQDEGQGDPILFVHGFPLDHTMWQRQISVLSATYRCLAVDLQGFGKSTVTHGTVTMERMADDLAALLDRLEITQPVTLCGLSMGGYVAWRFWERHRNKLARLILCDTRAIADTDQGRAERMITADKIEAEGTSLLADSMLPKLYAKATQQQHPELLENARKTILANSPAGVAAAARGMAVRPDITRWLPAITVPVLLLTGEHDSISTVDEMAGIANMLPKSKHVVIDHAGHMAPQEQPEATNRAILDFLTDF